MASITTRTTGTTGVNGVTRKDSPLTNSEIDTNFINLNDNKLEPSDLTSTNTANKGVKRDGSGNFSAGTITASLAGNSSTATKLAATKNINGVAFDGSSDIVTSTIYDSDFQRILNPGGGRYSSASASVSGAIAITLPSTLNTMIQIKLKVYEYGINKSFEVCFGGYTYLGTSWTNTFAYIVGNSTVDRRFNVRFGYTSTNKMIVYIGETTSTWSYPQIYITEALCGYGPSATLLSGWTVGLSSAFENVASTIASADTQVGYGVTTNTANSLVKRDGSGNFSAGTITASLNGTASVLVTGNNYQVNSLGVGAEAPGTAGYVTCTNLTETSSIALKENINSIDGALSSILRLNGVTYDRKDGTSKNEAGMIAEEVDKVLPNLVTKDEEGKPQGITYSKMVAYLVEAVKELKQELDMLKGSK